MRESKGPTDLRYNEQSSRSMNSGCLRIEIRNGPFDPVRLPTNGSGMKGGGDRTKWRHQAAEREKKNLQPLTIGEGDGGLRDLLMLMENAEKN